MRGRCRGYKRTRSPPRRRGTLRRDRVRARRRARGRRWCTRGGARRWHGARETNAVGVIPAVLAATAAARCAWASGDAATAAAELRSAISAAAEGARVCASHAPAAITSSATRVHPRVVSAAGDVAAASFALLPGATVDVPSGSSTALTMAAACASLAVGDFKAAEALLRDAQRGAVELAESSGGVQPLCAAASKALLGASLAARAKPTEVGGGGDPKAAKEAGKVLARAMRAAGLGRRSRRRAAPSAWRLNWRRAAARGT